MTSVSKEIWVNWKKDGIISTNEELIGMMHDLCVIYKTLDKVYAENASLITQSIMTDWYNLSLIARARNMRSYPSPVNAE